MHFLPNYPIETARLRLRPFTRGDVQSVFAYRCMDEVARFLLDRPMNSADCAEAVQHRIGQIAFEAEGDRIVLGVELRDARTMIGEVSLIWRSAEAQQGEVGYIFHPEHHGRGYATEAAAAMLQLGFESFGLHRILARCDARNLASWAVMERLGMQREAHLRHHPSAKGQWEEEFVYAAVATEWRMHHAESTTLVLQHPD